jgi:hypothetical protein
MTTEVNKAATKEVMQDLHALLAAEFVDILRNGIKAKDEEGNLVRLSATPAQHNVIRQFLKDNDIQAAMTSKAMKSIVDNLPFDESDLPPNVTMMSNHG